MFRQMCHLFKSLPSWVVLSTLMIFTAMPLASADEANDLVAEAEITLDKFLRDPDYAFMKNMIRKAKGVVIIPTLTKGGFIFGAEGGSALLFAKQKDGKWSPPAFYTAASGSVGLQIGVQVSEVILVIRNQDGLNAILKDNVTLGAEASIAAGPIGGGMEGATTTQFDADIVSFSKTAGLFGGGALEGGVITSNEDRNHRFYKLPLSGRDIVIYGRGQNKRTDRIRRLLPH